MVSQCIEDYQLVLQNYKLVVNIEIIIISVDVELLCWIFDNLLFNVVVYGVLDKNIYIWVVVEKDIVFIDVVNYGNKILLEKISNLFEFFVWGDGVWNDNVIGIGFGLFIVVDCVRIMYGEVNVIDVDYVEVCFWVVIFQQED